MKTSSIKTDCGEIATMARGWSATGGGGGVNKLIRTCLTFEKKRKLLRQRNGDLPGSPGVSHRALKIIWPLILCWRKNMSWSIIEKPLFYGLGHYMDLIYSLNNILVCSIGGGYVLSKRSVGLPFVLNINPLAKAPGQTHSWRSLSVFHLKATPPSPFLRAFSSSHRCDV